VACYLYLRPGELRALLWTDVDFEAAVVHVTKAYDEDSKTVKPPKTRNGVRDVPIPGALVPLLKVMHDRAADEGAAVLPLMSERSENLRSIWMRRHFTVAKVSRARLTEVSATTMKINFRSWRDTGITWLALAGIDVAKMQRRAGHDTISTTLGYVKMAEDLTGSIGEPFPALPQALVGGASEHRAKVWAKSKSAHKKPPKFAERAGFEPAAGF
jgi:integrase